MPHARLVPLVLILALLSACNLARITAPAPTPYPTPQPPVADGSAGVFPSITPLAGNVTTQTVFITATPIPGVGAQTVYVTATAFGSAPGINDGVSIAVTPGNPALAPAPPSTNVIDSLINNVAIPAWNFLYTLVLNGIASLWDFAGARGGLFAQGLCCLLPAVVTGVLVVRRVVSRRRWLL